MRPPSIGKPGQQVEHARARQLMKPSQPTSALDLRLRRRRRRWRGSTRPMRTARDGPAAGDERLVARPLRLILEVRGAAEDEQRDARRRWRPKRRATRAWLSSWASTLAKKRTLIAAARPSRSRTTPERDSWRGSESPTEYVTRKNTTSQLACTAISIPAIRAIRIPPLIARSVAERSMGSPLGVASAPRRPGLAAQAVPRRTSRQPATDTASALATMMRPAVNDASYQNAPGTGGSG